MSLSADDLDPQTLDNIAHARRLADTSHFSLPFDGIGPLLARRAQETPDKNFLTFYSDQSPCLAYTYRGFHEAASRVVAFLTGALGLQPGDRLATLMPNDPSTVLIYFGAWLCGLCVVPVNGGEDDARLGFILDNSQAKALFAFPDQAERCDALRGAWPSVPMLVQAGGPARIGWLDFDALTPQPPPPRTGEGEGGAKRGTSEAPGGGCAGWGRFSGEGLDALIVYTSGTTGAPKGVALEQGNLLADAQSIADWHRFGPDDRALNVLPIHHVNGIVVTLLTPLISGGSVVLSRKFRAQTFWQTLADESCTWTSVVPTILAFLCERRDDLTHYDLSHFRHILCGAGPLTTELARRFHDRFSVRVVHGYGLSETTCYSCFLPIDLPDATYRHWMTECGFPSIGCPLDVNDMAIHDAEGRPLAPGERGEIVVRGPNVMRGYFRRPDANRDTFAHGWFRSGDEGCRQIGDDGRDYYFITGRLKELIIRGGVNYSPFDIDEVLGAIPGVQAAMAVGFENDFYGEEIGAYVQREPGATVTGDDILRACRQKLPYAKSPKVVVFGETFPVTSTGKYQRLKLRPLFTQWKDAEFRERQTS